MSQSQGSCESCVINFGSAHDYKFATAVTDPLSEKQVAVMDRGFAALPYFAALKEANKLFVIRLCLNYKKGVNGVQLQLYACLCAYLIIQLLEIPEMWGSSLLDKLRFFQARMTQE